jgi:hypothetical protein
MADRHPAGPCSRIRIAVIHGVHEEEEIVNVFNSAVNGVQGGMEALAESLIR